MGENSKKTEVSADDIDLFLLLERGISFFNRYKWVYIIAIILGLGLGIYKYKTLPKVYQSQLIVQSLFLSNQNDIQIVDHWDQLIKHEKAQLAIELNCSENILNRLKKIDAEEIQKVFTPNSPHGFIIEVKVTDNAILDSLQQGIVYGFENVPYAKEKLSNKKANLQILIDKTAKEIEKLDSTKKMVEDFVSGKGRPGTTFIIDIASINKQLVEMNEKYLDYKDQLKFAKTIEVLQSFSSFSQPIGPHLLPWLAIGLLIFLSIAYICTLLHSIVTRLKIRSQQR